GDSLGNLIHLGERDCSVQRRHQKVIEESPCPVMTPELRQAMGEAAIKAAASVDYCGAGTVEFMLDGDGHFYFLEMNTRLQVEHPVTEMVTGLDLVAWQLEVASGRPLPLQQQDVRLQGHAIEVRLYAEDSSQDFMPQTGTVDLWLPAVIEGVRIDHGLRENQRITSYYDPMLAKLVGYGENREQARSRLIKALENSVLMGVKANQGFLLNLLRHPGFVAGEATTAFITREFQDDPSLAPQPASAGDLALAAALLYRASAERSTAVPQWHGWSNTARIPSRYLLDDQGRHHRVEIVAAADGAPGCLCVDVGGHSLKLHIISAAGSSVTFELDGLRQQRSARVRGARVDLYGPAGYQQLTDHSGTPPAAASAAASGEIRAPMDGAVTQVAVAVGEKVSKGQILIRMEAMKMEHALRAQLEGTVSQLLITEGQQVRGRQLLIELDAL
ncbi:MAG: biotin/lipoyl-binding protein, partial [Pseudomonas sp.]|nr:biotin/lipoyl-binding protein [Pseudomonas sp.]